MDSRDIGDAIHDEDKDFFRECLSEMDEDTFEVWYRGVLVFYDACQDHINWHGLEHLRDNYER